MAYALACQFCDKPCNEHLAYKHRYTHAACAERDYFQGEIRERWYAFTSESRHLVLSTAQAETFFDRRFDARLKPWKPS